MNDSGLRVSDEKSIMVLYLGILTVFIASFAIYLSDKKKK